ncbi:MAG: hypothetical protein M3068_00200 [Gemmatimonadota bacterium]|nr:hypothetical protein [Gemmatimonadota bacterium]
MRHPLHVLHALPFFFAALALTAQQPKLGTIDFPTSGSTAAQPAFIRGVLYMHSFEYLSAADAFREAQRLDPSFVLAYWGEAMSYNHPVWFQQDSAAARAVLARLGATPAERRLKAKSPREQGYMDAVELLYGAGGKEHRDSAYAKAMEKLSAAYPDDIEAATFHALAILGTSHGGRHIPAYLRAGAIVDPIFRDHPDHPGAAHYIIHSYDDPAHAELGLAAARAYSKIAPAAPHAQHMTSHIFLALGMWDDVVAANEVAWAASGKRNGHYSHWLAYGYLQQGRYADAERLVAAAEREAEQSSGRRPFAAMIRSTWLADTRQCSGAVTARSDSAGLAAMAVDYAAVLCASERGDRATATTALRHAEGHAGNDDVRMGSDGIALLEMRALVLRAGAKREEAAALLRQAAEMEAKLPYEFGPPDPAGPPRELLGELLLEMKRPVEAAREFELALRRTPRRARSLLGLARARAASGDRPGAEKAYAELRSIWHAAEPGVAAVAEASRGRGP